LISSEQEVVLYGISLCQLEVLDLCSAESSVAIPAVDVACAQ